MATDSPTFPAAHKGRDTALVAVAVLLVIAGLAGFYALGPQQGLAVRVVVLLVSLGLAAGVGALSAPGRDLIAFVDSARGELRRITWPSREETLKTTALIAVVVFIAAMLLGSIDLLLGYLVEKMTRLRVGT